MIMSKQTVEIAKGKESSRLTSTLVLHMLEINRIILYGTICISTVTVFYPTSYTLQVKEET